MTAKKQPAISTVRQAMFLLVQARSVAIDHMLNPNDLEFCIPVHGERALRPVAFREAEEAHRLVQGAIDRLMKAEAMEAAAVCA
jgi:hypothetical protein